MTVPEELPPRLFRLFQFPSPWKSFPIEVASVQYHSPDFLKINTSKNQMIMSVLSMTSYDTLLFNTWSPCKKSAFSSQLPPTAQQTINPITNIPCYFCVVCSDSIPSNSCRVFTNGIWQPNHNNRLLSLRLLCGFGTFGFLLA